MSTNEAVSASDAEGTSRPTVTRAFRTMPAPRALPVLGSYLSMMRDPLGFFLDVAQNTGPMARLRFGPYLYVLASEPEAVRRVLLESPRRYRKSRNYRSLERVLGKGLLTSEGDFWRRQRKLAQPAFHHKRLELLVAAMAEATADMIARWKQERVGTEIDVHAEMMRLTLRIAGKTLFGVDLDGQAAEIGEAVSTLLPYANAEVEQPVRLPFWVPTPEHLRIRRALTRLDEMVYGIIRERRASGKRHDDLLDMLMAATDEESGEGMTEVQLRDEIMTLILAGHETTASTLSFALHLLAQNPAWADALRDEAAQIIPTDTVGMAQARSLEVTGRIIEESMRLYPPAWAYEREALEDDVLDGYPIRAGTPVVICTWSQHRLTRFWDDPERFDPDRFLPDAVAARPRQAYLPFGDGPRVCIGKAFAMLESKVLLAMMVRDLDLRLTERPLRLDPGVTLRPKGGLFLRLHGLATKPQVRAAPLSCGEASRAR